MLLEKSFAVGGWVRLSPVMAQPLHADEILVGVELVRTLVGRAMPDHADEPVRRLESSGSTNSLFRLGDDLLVRLPRQPSGSAAIAKEARWLPVFGPRLPVSVPEVVAVFEPGCDFPRRWSVVRWIEGEHPGVVDHGDSVDSRREDLATDLAAVLEAMHRVEVPTGADSDPTLRGYRGEPLATMDQVTRENIERCRSLKDFGLDLDAVERIWDEALTLPGAAQRAAPGWYHGDLAAENLLLQNGRLSAVLDFGSLSVGDPTVDLAVAWEILDPPARDVLRKRLGVEDAAWLRGRAWALSITLMIWYYWTTMPDRRASRMAIGRNILADAGYAV